MNIIIRRGIKDGNPFVYFFDGNKIINDLLGEYHIKLTKTKDDYFGCGIFRETDYLDHEEPYTDIEVSLSYGNIRKTFEFDRIDYENDDILTIEQKLKGRLKEVREWVASIDHEEVLELSLPDE